MPSLCLATRNRHKAKELIAKLGEGWEVTVLADHPDLPEVEETADTFLGNATLKAVEISRHVSGWVLADDSGLAVDALQGAPGVWSARYAGLPSNDANNNRKVMADLAQQGAETPEQRTARYHCVLVIAEKGVALASFSGVCEGHLLTEPRGDNGFGYDPYFVPEGFTQTFGELPDEVKGRISHRVKVTDQFVRWCRSQS